ncbi:bifunctional DNA-formamidopyrimidine glycosylase/DNA-(apurinic or apyrimidinic site) lyase [Dehalobacter sp. DCM]|uniref:bifunctional DNA-formamidopyrimidine glycosylase/DNA-(apurinic or apyrimidinic site) lyase n=1 Tax=Dehalobacter sp. DCM TaxID=2907827 RepID=UPI003081E670|nr:bifunctional DNA-formamidopyrimidine glycosylase/DNA-(apurinic or apyrimidinic site) lyase [Dehalobacter sp. DCM]
MPELPEVETVRLTLATKIIGQRIVDIDIRWLPAVITMGSDDAGDFVSHLRDSVVESLDRRGKYLLINVSKGMTLIVHFRMTGRLVYYPDKHPPAKHTHVVFYLEDGELHYSDTRKFGRIQLVPSHQVTCLACLAKLGPEPLAELFTFDQLGLRLARKKSTIKAAILDQSVVAGLGNIYADEALFRAGISPSRSTQSLKVSEIILLYHAICDVLTMGIAARGTSFRDYRDGDGSRGSFQDNLMVYGRSGKKCKICGTALEKTRIIGRTTVYCPECQK